MTGPPSTKILATFLRKSAEILFPGDGRVCLLHEKVRKKSSGYQLFKFSGKIFGLVFSHHAKSDRHIFIHLRTFVPSYELRVKLLTCMPFRDVALQAKRGCLFSKRSEFRNFEMPIRISAISPKSSGIGTLFFPILPAATHVASW